jgi:hypothetical protein
LLLFLQQLEIDIDEGFRFDGLAVEEERLVFPLGDCVRSGLNEEWMPFLNLDFLYGAIASDEAFQSNPAGDVRLLGQRRISWADHFDRGLEIRRAMEYDSRSLFLLGWQGKRCEERTKESEDESGSHYRVRLRKAVLVPSKNIVAPCGEILPRWGRAVLDPYAEKA